jgi:protein O-mannosyl-transferase
LASKREKPSREGRNNTRHARGNPPKISSGRPFSPFPLSMFVLLILGVGLAVHYPSLQGTFHFDDRPAILDNLTIRALWPLDGPLNPPSFTPVAGRPVANVSLALDYAVHGLNPWGYHLFPVVLHLAAALLLFAIVRRTLSQTRLGGTYGRVSVWLAFASALLWAVHPLQTEAVAYLTQRTELLMGFFYLFTLYGLIRANTSDRPVFWLSLSVLCCALGMGSKEVMVSAPLMVLLYDRAFFSASFREVWVRRSRYYLFLAATWMILAALVSNSPRSDSVGFGFAHLTAGDYLRTQASVIPHYLRLFFWPDPLVLDYGWPVARSWLQAAPWFGLMTLLVVLSVAAWRFSPPLGFLGSWFFLILAPSSSILPIITEVAAERRMYLPLASLVVVIVIGGYHLYRSLPPSLFPTSARRSIPLGVLLVIVAAFGLLSVKRYGDYGDEVTMWRDVVTKRPFNARGHNNLGVVLSDSGRVEEGLLHFAEAVKLDPTYAEPACNFGSRLILLGRFDEALSKLEEVADTFPNHAPAHHNLAIISGLLGDQERAAHSYEQAIKLDPRLAEAHCGLGSILARRGLLRESEHHLSLAARLNPDLLEAQVNLAAVYAARGNQDAASRHYEAALRLDPGLAEAYGGLARIRTLQGRYEDAFRLYQQALRLRPELAEAHGGLAGLLARSGRLTEARRHYREAVRLRPDLNDRDSGLTIIREIESQRIE